MLIQIDIRYLDKKSVVRFNKIQNKVMRCYLKALKSSPIIISESDYLPNIFVIPFVREVVLNNKGIYVFNEAMPDPLEERHWAIFPSLQFLEIIEEKFVTACFAHELAHILDFTKNPNIFEELRKKHKNNLLDIGQELELRAREEYEKFREPVKSWLYELDEGKERNRNKIIESCPEIRKFKDFNEFQKYLKSIQS